MTLIRETDVARPVVEYLRLLGWTVYQEVELCYGRPDIVACLGNLVWIVEAKTSLSLKVLEQAYRWTGHVHYISVAVPRRRRGSHDRFALRLFEDKGIGVFSVRGSGADEMIPNTMVASEPRMMRRPHLHYVREIRDSLRPEMIDYAEAGSVAGSHWTRWKGTRDEVKSIVRRHPGVSISELIKEHGRFHYHTSQSARTSLVKNVELGLVPGVRIERDGRTPRLYPVESGSGVAS